MMTHIQSEIQPLKKVIVHRPYGLERLTPSNCDNFLFDDVLWPEKAISEHHQFVLQLQKEGVEVLFVDDLLRESLAIDGAQSYLIRNVLSQAYHGSRVENLLVQYLELLSPSELAQQLFSGLTFKELQPYSLGLVSTVSEENDFILPPLPNQLFARDSSAWIQEGVCLGRMAFPVRKPEAIILSTIYRYHPWFQKQVFSIDYHGDDMTQNLPSLEGGDIMVLNPNCLLVGVGQRTQPQALEILAKQLFQSNQVTEIIAVEIPKKRASMHLDTLLTMIDYDVFCSFYPSLDFRCWSIRPGEHAEDLIVEKQDALSKTLCRILGVQQIRVIFPCGDTFALEREQWNDAVNLLAVRPGVVFAYEQNTLTNRQLRQAGIEIITLTASELSRGRGGSRCMTCPIQRIAV